MLNTTYPMTLAPRTINGENIPQGWMAQHELAREIVAVDPTLDFPAWRELLAAINSNLPVVLVTRDRVLGRIRRTMMVDHAVVNPTNSRIRVHYWGFGHDLWLSEIESVGTPDVEYLDR